MVRKAKPTLTGHVSHLSRLDQMLGGSGEREENAKGSGSNICPSKERLPSTDPRDGGDDDCFGTSELPDRVV